MKRRHIEGFTLIELLITLAVLTVLLGIAIPYFLSTRGVAQGAAAKADLKTIFIAQANFFSGAGMGTYGSFTALEAQKLLPQGFSDSATTYQRMGYTGTLVLGAGNASFSITALPFTINSDTPSYFLDESGAVRYSSTGTANASSPAIGS
jgi:prepilin-type N-terminal cleavage/methylation domain-containing protein